MSREVAVAADGFRGHDSFVTDHVDGLLRLETRPPQCGRQDRWHIDRLHVAIAQIDPDQPLVEGGEDHALARRHARARSDPDRGDDDLVEAEIEQLRFKVPVKPELVTEKLPLALAPGATAMGLLVNEKSCRWTRMDGLFVELEGALLASPG